MNRSGRTWTHHSIVDEIIGIFADQVRSKIVSDIKSAEFYSLLMDKATDSSKMEQVSICARVVDEKLEAEEYFLEFRDTTSTKAEDLKKVVDEFIRENDMKWYKIRGQCFDGASNMSGGITGLQTRIRREEPRALYVHCAGHSVNLSVQDSLEGISAVRNVIGLVKDMINCIRESPKWLNQFKELQAEYDQDLWDRITCIQIHVNFIA